MDFAVRMGLASGFDLLCKIAHDDEVFLGLKKDAADPGVQLALKGRTLELLSEDFDRRYQHPRDMPVATYLIVLASNCDMRASTLVGFLSTYEKMHWGRIVALHILSGTEFPVPSKDAPPTAQ